MSHPEFETLGPYRVERTLGRGGMGTVYKGVHVKSGKKVAVKVIATDIANQSRFRRRFESEVETLKMLKHPNIVSLVGHGEEHGLLFYSMEYVDGRSLHEHLRIHNRMPWEDVLEIGIQTTSALKHAHDMGIIHRDLKPANLMLDKSGNVKLTDFGIAKLFGSTDMTAAGAVIGTADYMPPEQAEGKPVTTRSDLYSLGGVLYALLSGRAPFSGKSVPEVLYAVRYNPIPNLEDRAPNAPVELCELIHELLEKNAGSRPPTALVVRNRLLAMQKGTQARGGIQTNEQTIVDPPQRKVGTRLTSLDLSEEKPKKEDDSKKSSKRTGVDEPTPMQPGAKETQKEAVGTHEQQTMLAPDNLPAAGKDAGATPKEGIDGRDAAKSGDQRPSQSDFSHPGLEESESQIGPLSSGGPSHFTAVNEREPRPSVFAGVEDTAQGADWIQYLSVGGIIVTLLCALGFGWWMLQPKSANEIYESIIAASETGDDSRLLAAKTDIEEFLSRYPEDERAIEIQSFADEIELTRWTRVLQRRASREGGTNELSAIEQGFLECMEARSEDYDSAQSKLAAFLVVYGPLENLDRGEKRLVELVQFAQAMGIRPERKIPIATIQLTTLIQSAEKSLTGKVLTDYYENLLLLYDDKPWAKEQLDRIRKRLAVEEGN